LGIRLVQQFERKQSKESALKRYLVGYAGKSKRTRYLKIFAAPCTEFPHKEGGTVGGCKRTVAVAGPRTHHCGL